MTFDPKLTKYIPSDPTQNRFIFPTSIMVKYITKDRVGISSMGWVKKIHITFLQVQIVGKAHVLWSTFILN